MNNYKSKLIRDVLELSFGYDIDAIWYNLDAKSIDYSYREKIDIFCEALETAIAKGDLKIANEGVFLKGTPRQISDQFKRAFPKDENDISDIMFCLDSDNNFWTPGGGVWIRKDGTEIWT